MDPIFVPAPPRSAYNHNRRVSDLLLSQLKHFQHVEMKGGDLGINPEIARGIYTEAGAAKYIAAVTTALRSKAPTTAPSDTKIAIVPAKSRTQKAGKAVPVSIAASASESSSAKKDAAQKAAGKAATAKKARKRAR